MIESHLIFALSQTDEFALWMFDRMLVLVFLVMGCIAFFASGTVPSFNDGVQPYRLGMLSVGCFLVYSLLRIAIAIEALK